ncbi:hypothetical protein [Algiphilus aromaticivorans]|uniref:hypothetical protein n=1 Tax=Algiphilus aromaticivorans TaxID=382454 RepID=UPI0005C13CCB|nr:hypothetical protein [Algiphilus aromaticivorans]
MSEKVIELRTRRVLCDPALPSTYQPTRTVEQDERERVFGRDHAAAFAKRRRQDNDDGPVAA